MTRKKDSELTFFYPSLSSNICTDLLEVETYSNNLVVSPCIGNLIIYSYDEKPTPYLAKSWHREDNDWIFEIREGMVCENDEIICAEGFAKSLARSIRLYSQGGDHPIFKYLKGYKSLVNEKLDVFEGITANGPFLKFSFEIPVRGGFLEHLAMAPFGYICDENFKGDQWKDPSRIVSSSSYRLEQAIENDNYILTSREEWLSELPGDVKKVVIVRAGLEAFREHQGLKVIEAQNPTPDDLEHYKNIRQTPQSLIVVKLNALEGIFKDQNARRVFAECFKRHLDGSKYSNGILKADRLFPNDQSVLRPQADLPKFPLPKRPNLLMKVMLKGASSPNNLNKDLVLAATKELGWSVVIDSEPYVSFKETFNDPKYDIFIQAAEVGSAFEGWVVDMLFCSDVGDRWPDPSGRICNLARECDSSDLSRREASQRFHDYLVEDAALIPTFHRGGVYLFSDSIDVSNLGAMIPHLRFDQLRLSI